MYHYSPHLLLVHVDGSVTVVFHTDETNLPADIPSYLSSQGTLAERQDGYVPSESGSNHQYLSSSMGGFYMQPKDMNGKIPVCHLIMPFLVKSPDIIVQKF